VKPLSKARASTKIVTPKKATVKPASNRLSGTRKTGASILKRGKPLINKTKKPTMNYTDDPLKDFIRSLIVGKVTFVTTL